MTDIAPPTIGQEPWGDDLNTYLAYLQVLITTQAGTIQDLQGMLGMLSAQVATNTAGITANAADIDANQASIVSLNADVGAMFTRLGAVEALATGNASNINNLAVRVTALEAKPDYVFGQATYMFSTSMPPATGNQMRINNTDATKATMLDVRRLDADGLDRSNAIELMTPGRLIRLQDFGDSTKWYRFLVMAAKTPVGADNVNVPVRWHSGAGTLGSVKINVTMFFVVPPQ